MADEILIRLQPNDTGHRVAISRPDGCWDDLGQAADHKAALQLAGDELGRRLATNQASPEAVAQQLQEGLDKQGYAKVDLNKPAAQQTATAASGAAPAQKPAGQ